MLPLTIDEKVENKPNLQKLLDEIRNPLKSLKPVKKVEIKKNNDNKMQEMLINTLDKMRKYTNPSSDEDEDENYDEEQYFSD